MQANMWMANRRIYLDANGKAVEEKDPNKVTLLVAEGNTITRERALELGLIDDKGETIEPKVEKKAVKAAADKAVKPDEDK